MKRTTVVIAIAAAAVFGLSGCSGDTAPPAAAPAATTSAPATPTAAATTTPEPTESDSNRTVDLSLIDECMSLTEPLNEANTALLKLAEDTTNNPQSAVDMWRAFAQAFEGFGNKAANADVAKLAAAVGADGHALTDAIAKVYIDQDLGGLATFSEANAKFWESYTNLLELCDTAQ